MHSLQNNKILTLGLIYIHRLRWNTNNTFYVFKNRFTQWIYKTHDQNMFTSTQET